jgi:hypothetical protein
MAAAHDFGIADRQDSLPTSVHNPRPSKHHSASVAVAKGRHLLGTDYNERPTVFRKVRRATRSWTLIRTPDMAAHHAVAAAMTPVEAAAAARLALVLSLWELT